MRSSYVVPTSQWLWRPFTLVAGPLVYQKEPEALFFVGLGKKNKVGSGGDTC